MKNILLAIWRVLVSIKYSALAALVVAVLGLLGMGVLGMGLYYAVAFALPAAYPSLDDARGDWVWPALILVGMFWSVAFLLAGGINRYLAGKNVRLPWRRLTYALVLWLWALLLWFAVLNANRQAGLL